MKKILIVGASGGIGSVVANHFLGKGYLVIGTKFENEFQNNLINNKSFISYDVDITNQKMVEKLGEKIGEVNAIINCSGVVEFEAYNDPTENLNIWQRTIAVNLTGSNILFEKLKGHIIANGSFILMSSTDSLFGGKVNTAYAASKAGVNSLTKSLALKFQESKIRVNAIAPGWVETAMMEAGGDELVGYAKDINPLKRNGTPQDVANLVDYLISDESNYINGQIINLDGGYTLQDPTLVFEEQQLTKKEK